MIVLIVILCLLIPPLGFYAGRGNQRGFIVISAATIVAVLVFFGLYGGVGIILYGIAGILSASLVVIARIRKE